MNLIKKIPGIKKEEITRIDKLTRESICTEMKDKLLYLEKYSTDNKTYVMVPANHPVFPFPYNLKDRVKYRIKEINTILERDIDIKTSKKDKSYELSFKNEKFMEKEVLEKIGCKLEGKEWVLKLE